MDLRDRHDNYPSYESGMKALKRALVDYQDRGHKYIFHLVSDSNTDESSSTIAHFLRAAFERRSISPKFVNKILGKFADDEYIEFLKMLAEYELLIPLGNSYEEFKLNPRLANVLLSRHVDPDSVIVPSVIIHANREPIREVIVDIESEVEEVQAGRTSNFRRLGKRLWSALRSTLSKPKPDELRDPTVVYGEMINQATRTMDDVLNRLGPPPESLGTRVEEPEPSPAGAS